MTAQTTEWKAQINSWLEVSVYRRKRILRGAFWCVQGRERGRELGGGKGALLNSCALLLQVNHVLGVRESLKRADGRKKEQGPEERYVLLCMHTYVHR